METGYKIAGQDFEDFFEFFTSEEQTNYGVVSSFFSDEQNLYKIKGEDVKTALGGIFPASAGADFPGGLKRIEQYKHSEQMFDISLKGCRPIGIPLKDVGAGSYVIYRENGNTYFAQGTEPMGGEILPHSPQYVFFELQGAGGGGGGSVNLYSASGGGSGAYLFGSLKIEEPVYITISAGGSGGQGKTSGKGNDGSPAGDTTLTTVFDGTTYTMTLQGGKGGEGGNNGNSGGAGGEYSFTPSELDDNERYKIVTKRNGAEGSSRRTPPESVSKMEEAVNTWLKPEGGTFNRPGGIGGYSEDKAGYGGGGAASVFGDGGGGGYQHDGYTNEAAYGAGGGGGGNYIGRPADGGTGSEGRLILYY